jgi:hypothetical protein
MPDTLVGAIGLSKGRIRILPRIQIRPKLPVVAARTTGREPRASIQVAVVIIPERHLLVLARRADCGRRNPRRASDRGTGMRHALATVKTVKAV